MAGRVIKATAKYGSLTGTEALAKSSNVAAIKLGMRVGNQRMYDTARLFGFGNRTGIELPGESLGLLRPPSRWGPSSIGSVAMSKDGNLYGFVLLDGSGNRDNRLTVIDLVADTALTYTLANAPTEGGAVHDRCWTGNGRSCSSLSGAK